MKAILKSFGPYGGFNDKVLPIEVEANICAGSPKYLSVEVSQMKELNPSYFHGSPNKTQELAFLVGDEIEVIKE